MSQETERDIRKVCDEIHDMLVQKNRSYGDSALSPKGIFFKGDAEQGIRVRLDDKLSRLMGGDPNAYGEDPELDIMGYLVLLRICKLRKRSTPMLTPEEVAARLGPPDYTDRRVSSSRCDPDKTAPDPEKERIFRRAVLGVPSETQQRMHPDDEPAVLHSSSDIGDAE